jgi:hypothetical protein
MSYSKIILVSLLICSYCSINAFTRDEVTAHIFIRHKPHGGTHLENYIPADQPDVFYNSGNQVIIIDGGGEVAYYDVEIESMTTWLTVISTQVSGTYDTIDVSSLVPDEYYITITSPTGNEFEGYFEIE